MHHFEQKDRSVSSIPSAIMRDVSKPIEECEDYIMVRDSQTPTPTEPQIENLNKLAEQNHRLYEQGKTSDKRRYTKMDWRAENPSCGNISYQSFNLSLEDKHNHVGTEGFYEFDD